MSNIFQAVRRLGPTSLPVLITGESGTGKEVVAQSVHAASTRSNQKMVVVDCAAIPPNLMESELFGHRKGAFTGASSNHTGLVQAANGGTFFLDEIGELPPAVQTKLLRLLEDGSYRPIGETTRNHADLRFIAATNRNIEKEVALGRFRQDLFHRLNTAHIHIPPLRSRRSDILPLCKSYIEHFCQLEGRSTLVLSDEATKILKEANWSGNVRQVVNCAQYVVSLTQGQVIQTSDLPRVFQIQQPEGQPTESTDSINHPIRTDLPYMEAKRKWLEIFEDRYVSAVLEANNGNVSAAARESDMSRKSIQRIVKRINERVSVHESREENSKPIRSGPAEAE